MEIQLWQLLSSVVLANLLGAVVAGLIGWRTMRIQLDANLQQRRVELDAQAAEAYRERRARILQVLFEPRRDGHIAVIVAIERLRSMVLLRQMETEDFLHEKSEFEHIARLNLVWLRQAAAEKVQEFGQELIRQRLDIAGWHKLIGEVLVRLEWSLGIEQLERQLSEVERGPSEDAERRRKAAQYQ